MKEQRLVKLDGKALWTQETHRGSRKMERGSMLFSPIASSGIAVSGQGRR
jgi:hypothetical protein